MTVEMLKDRIAKAEAKIAKKENTIQKKTALIEKKCVQLEKMGVKDPANAERRDYAGKSSEIYWLLCDIETLQDDIKRGGKEIAEIKATLTKYRIQLEAAQDLDSELEVLRKAVPEIFTGLQDTLVSEWDRFDIEHREHLKKQYGELGYTEFIKKHHYTGYEALHQSDEEIHKENLRAARTLILSFYNRVKDITGQVKSWSGVHCTVGTYGYPALNGFVYGENGAAEVESIYAGGYNIQRLHVRVLVKPLVPKVYC